MEEQVVVLERSFYSTYAYQGAGLGMDGEMILQLGEWAIGSAKPLRVILLDMDPAESIERLTGARDRVESRDLDYHRRVRAGFLELAERFQDLFRLVDARGTPQDVHTRIMEALEDAL
jgi:dTMP kinase